MLSSRNEGLYGSPRSWTSGGPARRTRRAAIAWLVLSGVLASGGVAALAPSATAEVTAERAPGAGRAARAPLVIQRDIDYSVAGACEAAPEPGCYLDLYKEDRGSKKPLVVLIHGGGWIAGAFRDRFAEVARDLARAGYVSLVLDYPAASNEPYVPGTTMQEDAVNESVTWARANSWLYGIDTKKVAYIGGSSGGQLSLLAAFNANKAKPGKITMAYSLSGPVDLWEPLRQLQTGEVVPGDPGFEEGTPGFRNIELYLGCDWDGDTAPTCRARQAKAVSPLYIGDSTCPLVRITRSETEDMVEAEELVAGLIDRGCGTSADPRAEAILAGEEHGFAQWPLIGPSVIADLDEHMKPAPPPPPPPPGAS